MEKYLNTGIKEIIGRFPGVKDILDGFKIGCTSCNVGTCKLVDIVEIHNLSGEEEQELMKKIGMIIYPAGGFKVPVIERKVKAKDGGIKYSPPVKKLVDEHKLIKRLLALIPSISVYVAGGSNNYHEYIIECTDFIRNYADKYHHAKEEDILFKYFDEKQDIIQVMYEDHKKGRALVKSTLEALAGNDKKTISDNLNSYRELLTEHIKKEDEILFPWMDSQLSTGQIGEMYSKFNEAELIAGDTSRKYEDLIYKLESKF